MKLATRLVRYEQCPGDPYRPVATPIYQTATFEQESAAEFGTYDYSRSGNPTRAVLERQLAEIENARHGFAFASGMAAITAVTRLLAPGDEILAGGDLYGGAYRLFSRILKPSGVSVRYARGTSSADFRSALTEHTRLVYIETPGNPLLSVIDIREAAELAHSAGALLAVDNSMMSPCLQNPLDLGADVVIHSATKFLCGHSDVTAGVLAVNRDDLAERLYLIQNGEGTALGPFDSFLLLRGLKTLSLRVRQQQENALQVMDFLVQHPAVKRIHHPSIADAESRRIHRQQARGDGSIICFETGNPELSRTLAEATRIFAITVSFGSVNSSISLPHCMSHSSIPQELRAQCQFPADLVRLSVGIEDAEDLVADLGQAFAVAEAKSAEVRASAGAD
jgi:cystathionine beta-lyase